ncbi:hypothetical protein ACP70R_021258 [Stipagrostis hirtigluma subsp. patula]
MEPADDPRSASAIVAGTAAGHHVLHVECYSRTKDEFPSGRGIKSRPFKVGGRSWRIWYYPNGGSSDYADYISIFLSLDESVITGPVNAVARFSLLDQANKPVPAHTQTAPPYKYVVPGLYGFHDFIKRELLEASEHFLRDDDCFKIRCDIVISEEVRTEDRPAASTSTITVPPSDMHQHFGDLLKAKDGADVTFEVAGETFMAHRTVLAARSPVFRAELLGVMRESTSEEVCIQIDDMLAEVFSILLSFIYTDSLPEMEVQEEAMMAQHLLEAADRYDMPRLKLICEDKLCKHIDMSTVATTLVLAEQHHCNGLKEACIEFVKCPGMLEAVARTDGFDHLTKSCPGLVKELVSKRAAD